jgi:hypothetical protein
MAMWQRLTHIVASHILEPLPAGLTVLPHVHALQFKVSAALDHLPRQRSLTDSPTQPRGSSSSSWFGCPFSLPELP